jgi:hypothetical protein
MPPEHLLMGLLCILAGPDRLLPGVFLELLVLSGKTTGSSAVVRRDAGLLHSGHP